MKNVISVQPEKLLLLDEELLKTTAMLESVFSTNKESISNTNNRINRTIESLERKKSSASIELSSAEAALASAQAASLLTGASTAPFEERVQYARARLRNLEEACRTAQRVKDNYASSASHYSQDEQRYYQEYNSLLKRYSSALHKYSDAVQKSSAVITAGSVTALGIVGAVGVSEVNSKIKKTIIPEPIIRPVNPTPITPEPNIRPIPTTPVTPEPVIPGTITPSFVTPVAFTQSELKQKPIPQVDPITNLVIDPLYPMPIDTNIIYNGKHKPDFKDINLKLESEETQAMLNNFKSENWNNFTASQKNEKINEASAYFVDVLGISKKPDMTYDLIDEVKYIDANGNKYIELPTSGHFDPQTGTVNINPYYYDKPQEVLKTVAHEHWHARQFDQATNPKTTKDEYYKHNFFNYIEPNNYNVEPYYKQLIEVEAFAFETFFNKSLNQNGGI